MYGTLDVNVTFRNFRNIDLYHQGVYYLRTQVYIPGLTNQKQRSSSTSSVVALPSPTSSTTTPPSKKQKTYAPSQGPTPFATFTLSNAASIVDGIPLDRTMVLLGESTHGTEEFYVARAEITKRLIEERGFTAVVFEGDWPFFQTVAKYTKGQTQNPSPYPPNEIFPPW